MADVSRFGVVHDNVVQIVKCIFFTVCVLVVVGGACQLSLRHRVRPPTAPTRRDEHEIASSNTAAITQCESTAVAHLGAADVHSPNGRTRLPYRWSLMIVLLLVGVEANPGPARHATKVHNKTTNIIIGTINARSIVNKAANFHLTAAEEKLDVVAISETWVPLDAPDAISHDFVRPGYNVINAPRLGGRRGGGLAIVYREDLKVTRVSPKIKLDTFEVLVVRITVGVERFLLANLYRPPGVAVVAFLDELSDLDEALTEMGGHLFFIGNFNVPENTPNDVDKRMAAWLSCFNYMVVNDGPTHLHSNGSDSKFDLIIEPEKTRRLSSPTTISVGYFDHRLVRATLDCARPIVPRVSYSYRDFRRMDVSAFAAYLRQTISSTCPLPDVDDMLPDVDNMLTMFVSQLETDISTGLDRFAPIWTKRKRPGRLGNRWL